ncbi:beta strand repeat-containing protein [Undibacterium sp. Di24W]|uniref:beta strand repeat-containing protein n=1 Tax=Undibacterium sp. Di24W TaxID=3413033 RepID=UPI003BF103BA
MVSHTTYSLATKVARPLRLIYTLFGLLLSALLLASCGGGAGTVGIPTGKSLYTTAPATASIALGSTASYEIGGGTATYKASSSNATVASVEVKGTTLNVKGLLNGTAQIVISDSTGAQISISVTIGSGNTTVDLFVTAPSNLNLAPGFSNSFMIGGGSPAYFVSSSNTSIATVGINKNSFFVSGIKAGTAQIIIVDSAGTAVTVNVTVGNGGTVTPLYVTAAGTINSSIGEINDYMVGGGTGPYLVTSNNKSVATVTLTGNSVSVKGIAKGSAQIMVFDATGDSVSTTVVVDPTGTVIPLYIAAASAVTMEPGAKAVYAVGGGTAPYVATSSNINVAKAEVANNVLTVNAVSAGSAEFLVFDATGVSVKIALTVGSGGGSSVELYTTAGTGVVTPKGSSNTYIVGGGKAPYKATSSNSAVVTVPSNVSGTEFTISSVAVGSSQVTIFDATGASVSFSVTVSSGDSGVSLFTTAGNSITLAVGKSDTYVIGGGVAPYSSTSGNASVVTAKVSGGTTLELNPVAAGSTQVTVYDNSGNSVTIGVTVTATTITEIDVQPNGATGNVGDGLKFLVSGGKPPYAITVNNTSIASVAPATVTSSGGDFTATLLNVGSTVVTITDASGQTKAFTLTASQINTILRISPNLFVLGEDSKEIVNLNIFGGTPPYRAFTSDQRLSSVSIAAGSSVLSVGLGTNTDRCFTPFDSSGVRVPFGTFDITITVLDSLGATATATMTLKDNGRGDGVTLPLCG